MFSHFHIDDLKPYTHMHTTYHLLIKDKDFFIYQLLSQTVFAFIYYPNIRLQTLVQTQQSYLNPLSPFFDSYKIATPMPIGIKGLFKGFSPFMIYWLGDSFSRFLVGFGYANSLMATFISGAFYPFEYQQIKLASISKINQLDSKGVLKEVLLNYTNRQYWSGFSLSLIRNYAFYFSIASSLIYGSILPFMTTFPALVAIDNIRRCLVTFNFDSILISKVKYYEVY